MAAIPEIHRYRKFIDQRKSGGSPGSREHLAHRPRPLQRTPEQIKDATFVLGVPKKEFTPRVHEAMSLVFNEMDSLRWELELCRKQQTNLLDEIDGHDLIPIQNRHFLYRSLARVVDHVQKTGDESFLIIIQLSGLDAIWRAHGIEAVEKILECAAVVLKADVPSASPLGYLEAGSIGVILSISDSKEAEELGRRLSDKLNTIEVEWHNDRLVITAAWGYASVGAAQTPYQIHIQADQDVRLRS